MFYFFAADAPEFNGLMMRRNSTEVQAGFYCQPVGHVANAHGRRRCRCKDAFRIFRNPGDRHGWNGWTARGTGDAARRRFFDAGGAQFPHLGGLKCCRHGDRIVVVVLAQLIGRLRPISPCSIIAIVVILLLFVFWLCLVVVFLYIL